MFGMLSASYAMSANWRPFNPGTTAAEANGRAASISNHAFAIRYVKSLSGYDLQAVTNKYTGQKFEDNGPIFTIVFTDGSTLSSNQMTIKSAITKGEVKGDAKDLSLALRKSGSSLTTTLYDQSHDLTVKLVTIVRNDSDYAREIVTLTAGGENVPVSAVNFSGGRHPSAKVSGTVPGSPIVEGNIYLGTEYPMSTQKVGPDGEVTSGIDRKLPIDSRQSVTYSFVIGATPAGQLRRGFHNYVEEERARPYSPFLHYNSWYDLGYFTPYTADQCVNRINTFGEELVKKRGVKMSSYLFDDGWDDHNSVWKFNSGFPDGFTPLKEAAAKYGAGPGVWLSPWGGYGKPREERLAYGKSVGMEEDSQGYALSGPKYYERFLDVTTEFVTKYGINQFKFDGTGSPDKKYPGSKFDSDFDAAITLIGSLRKSNPKLFVNLTTGTWPSPFWLKFADSTWRGGYDHNFAGVGTKREQWLTYRDGDTYHGVVEKGPLYPINSLMLHGIIYAQFADGLKTDPGNDFRNGVRDYFATGTQLQEMYVTPSLLTKQNWDDLAAAAKWSWNNRAILEDVNWVGGDPLKLEVYGWAAWSPKKSILSLRNPSDHAQDFSIDAAKLLQLPKGTAARFKVVPAYADETGWPESLPIGGSKVVTLKPFQVLVMELIPEGHK